jgi:hypothetical protein
VVTLENAEGIEGHFEKKMKEKTMKKEIKEI